MTENQWRHPSRNPNTLPLTEIVSHVITAADMAILRGGHKTRADETRAAVYAALECALGNGLITLVPAEEWPPYIALQPPYQLPG